MASSTSIEYLEDTTLPHPIVNARQQKAHSEEWADYLLFGCGDRT